MKKHVVLLSFFLIPFFSFVRAQTDTTSVSYYLDDGMISNAKNVIKVNVVSPIMGDLPVYFERFLNRHFSIEVGVWVLLPYYLPELFGAFKEEYNIKHPLLGYSLWLHPRVYFGNNAPEQGYMGFQYRKRHYNLKNGQQIEYLDVSFNAGAQFYIGKRILLDYNLGIGFRERKYATYHIENKREGIIGIVVPFGFRLGFAF